MSKHETISHCLEKLGFGHRRDDRTANDGRRVLFSLASGEEIGRLDVFEAIDFLAVLENNRHVGPRQLRWLARMASAGHAEASEPYDVQTCGRLVAKGLARRCQPRRFCITNAGRAILQGSARA
ncbi:hypothetical protein GGR16_002632 [Chelatococcus caeni]|uniref:Uncharacterized protein n=1 Tax=Chelatococcus caeni TaxID=1348468 RepID=A0A840C1R1_9HYPH|nr:hypothetical protein [Chelatococcus caeni]MBB4017598.1 hypothetical protein [Chelatococcus caeni]